MSLRCKPGWVALVWAVVAAGAAQAQDLSTLYALAKDQDAQFQAARFAWEAAQQRAPLARAVLLPRLSYTRARSLQKGSLLYGDEEPVDKNVDAWNQSLQLTQGLIRPEQWMALRQAHAQEAQALAVFQGAQQDLILRVVQAYLDTWVAGENVRLADAQRRAMQAQLDLAKRNFEVGATTVTDVYEAQAKVDLTRAQAIAARSDLTAKQAELERLLGTAPTKLHGIDPDAALPDASVLSLEQWLAQARQQSPAVMAAQAAHSATEAELARQKAGLLPTLDLSLSKGTARTTGSFTTPTDVPNQTRSTQASLTLNWVLFEGGSSYYRIKESAAQMARAQAELASAERLAAAQVRQSVAAVLSSHAQLEALASGLVSSKKALDANRIGYRIGTRINIDVLNADNQVFSVERDLARTRAEALMHWLKLQAAAGQLNEDDVAQINALLQAEPTPLPNDAMNGEAPSMAPAAPSTIP